MESLLFGPADPRDSNTDSASAREAQQHLSGCAVCQSVAEKYRKADELLRVLKPGNKSSLGGGHANATVPGTGKRGPDCPDEQTWLSWAAGLLTDEEAAGYVAHAAACDRCALSLREAMEDLAYDMTPEEQKALAQLPTALPEWQREMATKLAAQQRGQRSDDVVLEETKETEIPEEAQRPEISRPNLQPRHNPAFSWWPGLAWAAAPPAVAIIAVAVGWLVWLKTREPDVNQLLAEAYTEQRTIELRMPG